MVEHRCVRVSYIWLMMVMSHTQLVISQNMSRTFPMRTSRTSHNESHKVDDESYLDSEVSHKISDESLFSYVRI